MKGIFRQPDPAEYLEILIVGDIGSAGKACEKIEVLPSREVAVECNVLRNVGDVLLGGEWVFLDVDPVDFLPVNRSDCFASHVEFLVDISHYFFFEGKNNSRRNISVAAIAMITIQIANGY